MYKPKLTILRKLASKKAAIVALFTMSAVISFATLGDGRKRANTGSGVLVKSNYKPGAVSLRSNYTYRGSTVLNTNNFNAERKVIRLNSAVTLQKGNNSIIVPLKKSVVVSRITFGVNNKINQRN